MKILYLHRTRGVGVEAVHIQGIANAFRRLGHQVVVLYPNGLGEKDVGTTQATAGARSRDTHRFMTKFSRAAPEFLFECAEMGYNLPGFRTALAAAKSLGCDIIYERYAIFGAIGALLSAHLSLPWILEVNYTSQCRLVRKRSRIFQPLAKLLEQRMFPKATSVVAVSSFLGDHLVRDYGVRPASVLVLPNAADPAVFRPDLPPQRDCGGKPLDGRIIGFVGGFYPWHRPDLLLEGFLSVMDEFADAKLLLVGDGPEKRKLMDQVERAGVGHRVLFAGTVSHEDLPKWIAAFHIGVMPDSNEYGSPMKIFEYMSMGKPVVVPDYAPLRDAVDDGVEGLIFPAGSAGALADRMRTLLGDPRAYSRMAEAARRKIVCRYNWEQNAREILEGFS